MKVALGLLALSVLMFGSFVKVEPFAGMAMHTKALEVVDTKSNSPMGIFGVRVDADYIDLWINHISSIPDTGIETRGINLVGGTLKYRHGNTEAYAGVFTHSEEFDGQYYSKQFSKNMKRVGIRYHYDGDKVLFIDYIDSFDPLKSDWFMYGMEWRFKDVL